MLWLWKSTMKVGVNCITPTEKLTAGTVKIHGVQVRFISFFRGSQFSGAMEVFGGSSSFWYHLDIANVWVVIMTVGNYLKCGSPEMDPFFCYSWFQRNAHLLVSLFIMSACLFNNRANSPWFHWIISFLVGPKFLSVQIGVPKKTSHRTKKWGHQCQHKS